MSNIIIEHKDGRRYGTTTEGFARLRDTDYAGFKVVGEETPADFVVTGIPAPRRHGSARPKAKAKARIQSTPQPLAATEPEAPTE